ncbi:MAG: TolC family protein [Rhodoferax sp.]|nr:TolC family protein [Rhodoferax sp.]
MTAAWRSMVPLALGCALSLGAATAQAQTLAQALEQAWARHPLAVSFAARQGEALARAEAARALTPAPATASLSNTTDRFNSNAGKRAWEIELATPLWLPGQRAARGMEAERAVAELAARRAALRLQIAGELRAQWWALAQARQQVALAQRREQTAGALLADVQRRLRTGEVARLDSNLAHNEHLLAQADLAEAQAAVRVGEQNYRVLTGQDAPSMLGDEVATSVAEPDATHPVLQAASSALQLAQARLALAQQTRREAPELALRWVRERDDSASAYTHAVGIKLTLPFSSGAQVRQDGFAAQAEVDQAEAELVVTRQRVAQDVQRERAELEQARTQLARALTRRDLTADTLRLTEKSYALGESDLPSLLRARASAWESETAVQRQRVAEAASVSRLNQSLGVMP